MPLPTKPLTNLDIERWNEESLKLLNLKNLKKLASSYKISRILAPGARPLKTLSGPPLIERMLKSKADLEALEVNIRPLWSSNAPIAQKFRIVAVLVELLQNKTSPAELLDVLGQGSSLGLAIFHARERKLLHALLRLFYDLAMKNRQKMAKIVFRDEIFGTDMTSIRNLTGQSWEVFCPAALNQLFPENPSGSPDSDPSPNPDSEVDELSDDNNPLHAQPVQDVNETVSASFTSMVDDEVVTVVEERYSQVPLEDSNLPFLASQTSNGSDDNALELAVAEHYMASREKKKKEQQKKFFVVGRKLVSRETDKASEALKTTALSAEELLQAFTIKYAAEEDTIRGLWSALYEEQRNLHLAALQKLSIRVHSANLQTEVEREASVVKGMSRAREAILETQRVIDHIYTKNTL